MGLWGSLVSFAVRDMQNMQNTARPEFKASFKRKAAPKISAPSLRPEPLGKQFRC